MFLQPAKVLETRTVHKSGLKRRARCRSVACCAFDPGQIHSQTRNIVVVVESPVQELRRLGEISLFGKEYSEIRQSGQVRRIQRKNAPKGLLGSVKVSALCAHVASCIEGLFIICDRVPQLRQLFPSCSLKGLVAFQQELVFRHREIALG